MTTVQPTRAEGSKLFQVMSLRQLQWATFILPLLFVLAHHYLMVAPLHRIFHTWYGFTILLMPIAVAVWMFSHAVFGFFGQMQAEIKTLNEQAQAQVVELERQHIAREMHDGLAQVLSFVNTKAQAVEQFLRQGNQDAAREQMAELSGAARKVYADIREGIVALRVETRGDLTLHQILDEYVEEFRNFARLPVEIVWDVDDDLQLPPVVEVQTLRIVQEALSNVRRHAHAGQAWVTFADAGDTLEVSVRDDGQGFDPGRITRGEWPQFGLRSMRERAEAAGGALTIDSAPGRGTTVRATFPSAVAAEVHA